MKIPEKIFHIFVFIIFYLRMLILSNFQVARDILSPTFGMSPAILGIGLDIQSDSQILILSSLITMTPGTLSMDISDDKKTIFIHAMYAKDPKKIIDEIKYLEKKVMKAF